MKELQLRDAKATLSAVVDQAVAGEPTVITRHGRKEAVLLSFEEFQRISRVPDFADLLLAFPGEPDDIPERARKPRARCGIRASESCTCSIPTSSRPPCRRGETPMPRLSPPGCAPIATGSISRPSPLRDRGRHRPSGQDRRQRQAPALRRWLAAIEHFYASRILPFGIGEARQAGAILDRARAHDSGFEDIAIAATAAAHDLTVLTANEQHFAPLGVPFANPLKELPAP